MYYATETEYYDRPTYNAESCHKCTGRFNAETMHSFDVGTINLTTLYLCNGCEAVHAICLDCSAVVGAGLELCTECEKKYN
jgi:hypothetical protein